MKNSISMVVYLITFFAMYLILSLFGLILGYDYKESIESETWFIIYTIFLGWWIALVTARDAYQLIEKSEQ